MIITVKPTHLRGLSVLKRKNFSGWYRGSIPRKCLGAKGFEPPEHRFYSVLKADKDDFVPPTYVEN